MRFLPKSLTGQLVLILLLGLVAAQGISLYLFASERKEDARNSYHRNVISRTVGLARLLNETPPELHSRIVATASSGPIRFGLQETSPIEGQSEFIGKHGRYLRTTLANALNLPIDKVLIERRRPGYWHHRLDDDDDDDDDDDWRHRKKHPRWRGEWVTLAVGLADDRWLRITTGPPPGAPRWGKWFLLSLFLSGAAIVVIAVLAGRRVVRPMRELAEAAGRLGRGEHVGDVTEAGPKETRETVRAFNEMQTQLDRYMRDRSAMLAAVSHDLKTPITSLRLRAEFIDDQEMRGKILATLDEMQSITESTLDFIREDASRDPGRSTDISALAESIVTDFTDMGRPAEFSGVLGAMVVCRATSIRRALRNLIDNAISYGGHARVFVETDVDKVDVHIDDDGPGIPNVDLENVFDPFVRLEDSRSRTTGGVGLGLAITRTIARAHGGEVTLENRPEGGLRATLSLPRAME